MALLFWPIDFYPQFTKPHPYHCKVLKDRKWSMLFYDMCDLCVKMCAGLFRLVPVEYWRGFQCFIAIHINR